MGVYICAWCGKRLNDIVFEGDRDSHGICPECKKKVDAEFNEFLKRKTEMESISQATKQKHNTKGGKFS
jgi:DNA-directed RNA polymerase subunit RPC12/RpoP